MSPRFVRNSAAAGIPLLQVRAFGERWPKSNKQFWRKLVKPLNAPASPDGVLLVDKAEGMTSHDVVALARRQIGTKKIGHCGTLDPPAPGCLLLRGARGKKVKVYPRRGKKKSGALSVLGEPP